MTMDKIKVLKIDKDCHVDKDWIEGYIKTIILICKTHGVEAIRINMCPSKKKGLHFYIAIIPPIDAQKAIYLHWLLGDDTKRVDFNRARIEVGFNGWNKLFEEIGTKLTTIFRARVNHSRK